MAITGNRNYNDPALGAAFGNLASLFAPPGGTDLAGYATANAKNQEAQRLAELYASGRTPSEKAALAGVMAYGSTPQGFNYKTDQDNATVRATNEADNATALAMLYATPVLVNEGQTAFLPQQTQEATGLPGVFTGAVRAQPGDRVALPSGQVVEGAPKPMTEDELRAQLLSGMPAAQQNAWAFGSTPLESVIRDGQPTYTTRLDAIGQQPAPSASGGAPETQNYKTPDGTTGSAVYDRTRGWVDTQTGAALPQGSVTFSAALQGDRATSGLGGKSTEAQDKNAYAAEMASGATEQLLTAFDTGAIPSASDYQLFVLMRTLPMSVQPALVSAMSPQGQLFYQNVRTALPYQLMSQSGQAVTEQEYERKLLELVPVPGEDPAVTAAKRRQFETYIATARAVAGPAYDNVEAAKAANEGQGAAPAPQGAAPTPAQGGIPTLNSPEEAATLPSGTQFYTPDGRLMRVP